MVSYSDRPTATAPSLVVPGGDLKIGILGDSYINKSLKQLSSEQHGCLRCSGLWQHPEEATMIGWADPEDLVAV